MPFGANSTLRQITKTQAPTRLESQEGKHRQPEPDGASGNPGSGRRNFESSKPKVVGEPDEGKPHVRFEVAEDGLACGAADAHRGRFVFRE